MTSLKISDFINNLGQVNGPASAARFFVSITIPQGLGTATDAKRIGMLCEAAPLPGIAIATNDRSQPYGFGPVFKMPWGVIFTDINLNFIGDNNGYVHNFFTKWLNLAVPFNTTAIDQSISTHTPFFVNYSNIYKTTIVIQALDLKGDAIITYTLYDAWPTLLDDIQQAWSAENQYVKIPVRFNFFRWTVTHAKSNTFSTNPSSLNINNVNGIFTSLQADFLTDITGNLTPTNSNPFTGGTDVNQFVTALSNLPTLDFNF
jgi:hypothetical protein